MSEQDAGSADAPDGAAGPAPGSGDAGGPTYCWQCGERLARSDAACPHCGALLAEDAPNRVTAAIAALTFGGFGLHWFYLGRVRRGALYWCLIWTLVPFVLASVEGVYWLLIDDAQFRAKYAAE